MKYSWFLLLCSISWYLLECKAEKYEECSVHSHGDTMPDVTRCFPDNTGFADFSCVRLSDVTKNYLDADTFVWKQVRGKTDCKKPFNGCQCFEDDGVFYYKQYCKCYAPDGPPKFPSTGAILWKGGWQESDYYYGETNRDLMGEVHKNSNGQYMKIEWIVGQKSDASFEILIPDNRGMFTKYSGKMGKGCSVNENQSEKTLSSIWGKYSTDKYIDRINVDGKIQEWKKFEYDEDWDATWKWAIEYNEEKDHAIPISYYHSEYFDSEDRHKTTKYNYTYQSIGDDESFDFHTYCSEEKWR